MDPHQAAAITDSTLRRYRAVAAKLVEFLQRQGCIPDGVQDWDDSLFVYKQVERISKADFEATVASVEFFFPRFRGGLKRSRAIIKGWSVWHVPRHTVPLGRSHALLVAIHMSALSAPAMGLGVVVQRTWLETE